MNIQMRIITEDNVDQLLSMSYSDNINKLMKSNKTTSEVIGEYGAAIKAKMAEDFKEAKRVIPQEQPVIPEPAVIESTPVTPDYVPESPPYAPESPAYGPATPTQYAPEGYTMNSPEYNGSPGEQVPQAAAVSPEYQQRTVEATTNVATEVPGAAPSILEVKPEVTPEASSTPEQSTEGVKPEEKKTLIIESSSSSTPETSSGVKKITI